MRRPVGSPVTSSPLLGKARRGLRSRKISPPKQLASTRSNYVTAERLHATRQGMSERDWSLLLFVSGCRLASGQHLIRQFWLTSDRASASARAGRRALKRLIDWRVLVALPRRVGGERAGSAGMVYAVGVAGARLLAAGGFSARRLEAPGALYVAHTLACTELVVELHEADREGALDAIEVQSEPVCWRGFLGPVGARLVLKPDLFVRVGAGAFEDRWFIEVDLATEASGTILAKARRYLAHYQAGSEQAEHGVYPRVLWAAPDPRRAEQIEDALRRLPSEGRRLFSVCLLDEAVAHLAVEARS